MESKISYSYINSYSADLAQQLSNSYFSGNHTISGKQILEFTELKQINLFILKVIFHRWQKELENLKSPYFDYSHEAVISASRQYMNKVSNYILVQDDHFRPLLQEAIANTMLIIFSPYDFYHQQLTAMQQVNTQTLKENFKFVRINKHLFDEFIGQIEATQQHEFTNEEALALLEGTFEQTDQGPEDIDSYVDQLSRMKGLQIEKVYVEAEPVAPRAEQPVAEPSLNEQLGGQKTTLNERLQDQVTASPSIADLHQQKKYDSIKRNITINQRFMFVNELFKGDMEQFNAAIDALDGYGHYQQALDTIEQQYAVDFSWDMESEEVQEFLEVVAKRFGQ